LDPYLFSDNNIILMLIQARTTPTGLVDPLSGSPAGTGLHSGFDPSRGNTYDASRVASFSSSKSGTHDVSRVASGFDSLKSAGYDASKAPAIGGQAAATVAHGSSAGSYGSNQTTPPPYAWVQSASTYGSVQMPPSYASASVPSSYGAATAHPYGSAQALPSYGQTQAPAAYGHTQQLSSYGLAQLHRVPLPMGWPNSLQPMDLGEQQLMLAVITKLFTDANNLGTLVFFLYCKRELCTPDSFLQLLGPCCLTAEM
jgi:hypothetical protein